MLVTGSFNKLILSVSMRKGKKDEFPSRGSDALSRDLNLDPNWLIKEFIIGEFGQGGSKNYIYTHG